MQFKVQSGSGARDHALEISPSGPVGVFHFVLDGERGEASWVEVEPGVCSLLIAGKSHTVAVRRLPASSSSSSNIRREAMAGGQTLRVTIEDLRARRRSTASSPGGAAAEIRAPMPGRIVKVLVNEGDAVTQGDGLIVMEAMKMQNEIRAPRSGRAAKIHVREGQGVETGARLVEIQ